MRILAINVGSSSVKCAFFEVFGEATAPDQVTERWQAQEPVTSPEALTEALPRMLETAVEFGRLARSSTPWRIASFTAGSRTGRRRG